MTKAVYAGTFDMPTLGHFEVIKKAVKAFGEVKESNAYTRNK